MIFVSEQDIDASLKSHSSALMNDFLVEIKNG
jgi:hypothetical protein